MAESHKIEIIGKVIAGGYFVMYSYDEHSYIGFNAALEVKINRITVENKIK